MRCNISYWCKNFVRTWVRDVLPQYGCCTAYIASWSLQARKTEIFKSITQRLCSVWESSKGYLNRRDGGLQSSAATALQCIKKHKKNTVSESIQQVAGSNHQLVECFSSKIGHLWFQKCPSFFQFNSCKFFGQPSYHQHLLGPSDSSSTHVLQIRRWTHRSQFRPPIRRPLGRPGSTCYVFLSRNVSKDSKGQNFWK